MVLEYRKKFLTFWWGNRIRDRCWVTILTRHLSTSILMYTVRDLPFMSYCSCKYISNYCRYNVYNLKGTIDAMIICLFLYISHKIPSNWMKLFYYVLPSFSTQKYVKILERWTQLHLLARMLLAVLTFEKDHQNDSASSPECKIDDIKIFAAAVPKKQNNPTA